jgi:hypothetical protein
MHTYLRGAKQKLDLIEAAESGLCVTALPHTYASVKAHLVDLSARPTTHAVFHDGFASGGRQSFAVLI